MRPPPSITSSSLSSSSSSFLPQLRSAMSSTPPTVPPRKGESPPKASSSELARQSPKKKPEEAPSSSSGRGSSPWQSPRPKTKIQHLSTQARSQSVQQKVSSPVVLLRKETLWGRKCLPKGSFRLPKKPLRVCAACVCFEDCVCFEPSFETRYKSYWLWPRISQRVLRFVGVSQN